MSGLASGLFSSRVVTREGSLPTEMPPLPRDELACVASAVLVRQLDFAAGRELARAALEALGVRGFSLVNDAAGAPVWPPGVVGSITHTRRHARGLAAVALADAAVVRSVGIDAESDEGLTPDLWPSVLRDEERARLDALPERERVRAASIFFSAKECYYKLQFPLTRQFLDFTAVTVDLDETGSAFRVLVRKGSGEAFREGDVFVGRFACGDGLVVTGLELGR
jgi:4'-phosphopantetheinyl transferase EntD